MQISRYIFFTEIHQLFQFLLKMDYSRDMKFGIRLYNYQTQKLFEAFFEIFFQLVCRPQLVTGISRYLQNTNIVI